MIKYKFRAKLENLIKEWHLGSSAEAKYRCEAYKELLEYIDNLQDEPVSEDLEAEFDRYCDTLYLIDLENEPYAELFECAKYFFELGLKAQRKISYVPNIDDSLKELGIDPSSKEAKIFKESYCAALDKFMAQKGE